MIDSNFNKNLLRLYQELSFWERIVTENELPHFTSDVLARKPQLMVLRDNVLLVVRDYNRIISVLSPDERGLFRDRIRFLDKKIQPGLTKLTWASKGVSDYFIVECRSNASKLQQKVDEYKKANTDISRICLRIADTLLVRIDSRKVYEDAQFEEDQRAYRDATRDKIIDLHDEIVQIMRKTQEIFINDPDEVRSLNLTYNSNSFADNKIG